MKCVTNIFSFWFPIHSLHCYFSAVERYPHQSYSATWCLSIRRHQWVNSIRIWQYIEYKRINQCLFVICVRLQSKWLEKCIVQHNRLCCKSLFWKFLIRCIRYVHHLLLYICHFWISSSFVQYFLFLFKYQFHEFFGIMCSLLTLTERSQMRFKAICFQIVKLFRFHISLKHTELRVLSTYYLPTICIFTLNCYSDWQFTIRTELNAKRTYLPTK